MSDTTYALQLTAAQWLLVQRAIRQMEDDEEHTFLDDGTTQSDEEVRRLARLVGRFVQANVLTH